LKTRPTIVVALSLAMVGCASEQAIDRELAFELAHPPAAAVAAAARLEPDTLAWYHACETAGLAQGRPLDAGQMALARAVGVRQPERVRIVAGFTYPAPADPKFEQAIQTTIRSAPVPLAASTFGYAIFINPNDIGIRSVLAHELTHVAQFERLGMPGFVHQFVLQLTLFGHLRAPLEREARANGNRFR